MHKRSKSCSEQLDALTSNCVWKNLRLRCTAVQFKERLPAVTIPLSRELKIDVGTQTEPPKMEQRSERDNSVEPRPAGKCKRWSCGLSGCVAKGWTKWEYSSHLRGAHVAEELDWSFDVWRMRTGLSESLSKRRPDTDNEEQERPRFLGVKCGLCECRLYISSQLVRHVALAHGISPWKVTNREDSDC